MTALLEATDNWAFNIDRGYWLDHLNDFNLCPSILKRNINILRHIDLVLFFTTILMASGRSILPPSEPTR